MLPADLTDPDELSAAVKELHVFLKAQLTFLPSMALTIFSPESTCCPSQFLGKEEMLKVDLTASLLTIVLGPVYASNSFLSPNIGKRDGKNHIHLHSRDKQRRDKARFWAVQGVRPPDFAGPMTLAESVEAQLNFTKNIEIGDTGKFISHHRSTIWLEDDTVKPMCQTTNPVAFDHAQPRRQKSLLVSFAIARYSSHLGKQARMQLEANALKKGTYKFFTYNVVLNSPSTSLLSNPTKKELSLSWPQPHPIGSQLDRLVRLALTHPSHELFRVKVDSNRILPEGIRGQELVGLFGRVKIVHLCFDVVSIRILVVHTGGSTVIHAPEGPHRMLLTLLVCKRQVIQVAEREGDVLHACRVLHVIGSAREASNENSVVFLVVGQEAHVVTLERDPRPEKGLPEFVHSLVLVGSKDNVSQSTGTDDLWPRLNWLLCHRSCLVCL